KQFESVFPELNSQLEFVSKVVKEEEESFLRTLDKGLKKIDDIISNAKSSNSVINGTSAFELFDTYGFPIDLTRLIASENNLQVDEKAFEREMQQQKTRSRSASAIDTEDWIVLDDFAMGGFVGYDSLEIKTKVVKYRKITSKGKEAYQLILDTTPFYAESGGQVGDTGTLTFDEEQINVLDTKKENDLIVHFIDKLPAKIESGVLARVDVQKRRNTEIHHSATHLLHAALRQVLGTHVAQKGSLVNQEHLRFDFSHFSKVTDEEISKIEAIVNEKIRENIPVVIKQASKDEAIEMGAMALFGEKYGDVVRVVMMDPSYSIELCGGTHVGSTGQLGLFKIKHETAVAAGVRRIEAVSGNGAEQYINTQLTAFRQVKEALKNPKDVAKAVENLQSENAELRKKIESMEVKQLTVIGKELLNKAEDINGITFIGQSVEVSNSDALKKLCIDLKPQLQKHLVVLTTKAEGKAYVAIMVDEETSTSKNIEAPKVIKEHIASIIKGGGGGQKTLATAGGQDASNLQQVIDKVKSLL
ncbi:MAG TPA: alanine--tRNA ligase-related protein, partial [Segetibacter sp.]